MKFWKMHGAGNDFIVLDHRSKEGYDLSTLASMVCHRQFGVGADGMLAVEESEESDIKMVYYNRDGSLASMCGNGIRCFAKYVRDNEIVKKDRFTVETGDGEKRVALLKSGGNDSIISVDMGKTPEFRTQEIEAGGVGWKLAIAHLGVPHAIVFLGDTGNLDLDPINPGDFADSYGELIEKNREFPQGINVNFVTVHDESCIEVTTWERGAGKTLACGTGACASAAALRILKRGDEEISVIMPGGNVKIHFKPEGTILMEGGAHRICTGEYHGEEGNR